jgi:two-component system, NtrC family, sensor histidine kinase PilS
LKLPIVANISGPRIEGRPPRRLLSRLLFFRILVIILFLGGTILFLSRSGQRVHQPVLPYLYLLVGLSFLHAIVSATALSLTRHTRFFAQAQVIGDLLLATAFIYLTGGTDSLFSFLYLLVIVGASVLLPRRDVLFVASAASILYGSLLDLQYYGFLPVIGGLQSPGQISGREVFYEVFVNVFAFLLTALLSGTLSERLRRSEAALEQKEIDFDELENFNRAILTNITSGLMIANDQGRIRSFNDAAERITGLTLRQVYNREVRALFPDLGIEENHSLKITPRGQGTFLTPEGARKVLGFSSSLLRDGRDRELGVLVVFQDLTQLVEMEEKLKRTDRLAAIGRLAAGMAHEIRNPLASISGSIQLLMEQSQVREEDRRLMGIVVREADRLGALLTDFLLYARPARPVPEALEVADLFDEVLALAESDGRFQELKVERHYQPGVTVVADRKQLRQILWDLLINAAEAIGGKGTLRVGVLENGQALFVEDSGTGVPCEMKERIFEPFFTTKTDGIGLGLATVHTLVEANGGQIAVTEGSEGGALFVIRLERTEMEGESHEYIG